MSSAIDNYNFFGNTPNLVAGIIFLVVYALLGILHLGLVFKSRSWWTIITPIGIAGECIGWIGRILGHSNVYSLSLYLLQNICLGIAPVFYSATCYIMFGIIVTHIDVSMSRLKPRQYALVFLIFDVACLCIQGTGGGLSGAAASEPDGDPTTGSHIFLAGIALQLVNMIIFVGLMIDYLRQMRRHKPEILDAAMTKPMKLALRGVFLASFLIILRNTYRCPEMATGFQGVIVRIEALFDCLDALPMWICGLTLAICHPYFTLQRLLPAPAFLETEGPVGTPADIREKSSAA